MQPCENLETLAERVQQGDALAKKQLQDRLERHMGRIARRALARPGFAPAPGASSLGRKIQLTAQRLDPEGKTSPHLVRQVASNLCQTVVTRLWTGATEGLLHTMAT
ncbi:MAG: hypothetical protein HY040_18040 [Planctomycetes bacterium]|nr:hypothetical protein [Planctomycetota bacterium]